MASTARSRCARSCPASRSARATATARPRPPKWRKRDAPPVWSGAVLDRNGTKTAVPVAVGERSDAATGQRWLTADITLAPLGAGDYVIELSVAQGSEQKKTLVAIRVTQ